MSPIVEGIAKRVGYCFGPGLKLFLGRGVAGDVGFGDAVGPHRAPFVVVVPEP